MVVAEEKAKGMNQGEDFFFLMHAAKVSSLLAGKLVSRVSRWCVRRTIPCLTACIIHIVRVIGGINRLWAVGAVSIGWKTVLRGHGSPRVLVLHVLLTLSNRMLHHMIRHAFSQTSFLTFTGIDLPNQAPRVHLWLRPASGASEVEEG